MLNSRVRCFAGVLALVFFAFGAANAETTVGLMQNDPAAFEGYTLFAPLRNRTTYLIDNQGREVHSWASDYGNIIPYLLENGDILRAAGLYTFAPAWEVGAGGRSGRIEQFDWEGNLLWEFQYMDDNVLMHHDIEALPNGNVLFIAWEVKSTFEAVQAGRDPASLASHTLWPEHVLEVQPTPPSGGNIVWEWHLWDHVIQDFDPTKDNFGVIADHPELVDLNWDGSGAGSADWVHMNAIDYNAELDQILLSARRFSEVWIIDHSTTTAEASGHTAGNSGMGGDLLYRWGNPEHYGHGTAADRHLYRQHDAQWIEPGKPGGGNILIFNNGWSRPAPEFSSAEEIVPPGEGFGYLRTPGAAFGPITPVWRYEASPPESFYARFVSSAHRMWNGNTLLDNGPAGTFFEVTADGDTVWKYVNPTNNLGALDQGVVPVDQENLVHRARRYAPNYPGLVGRDLTPGLPIESFIEPLPVADGSGGSSPLTVDRLTTAGDQIQIEWDSGSCAAAGYNLIYGNLGDVSTYALTGASCDIGVAGSFFWDGVASGDAYWLIVGVDATGSYESSRGADSSGVERNGTTPSGYCNVPGKIDSGTCP